MADTTNDIWNDNDGEEDEAPRKGGRLRRFGIFFLVLAAVLGVVLVAAYRDGTGFDALRRLCSYGSGEESTAEAQYDYDASDSNSFAVLGDSLVVLSDTKMQILARGGEEIWSTSVRMSAPALETGGGRAVAYDVGGTELYVVDEGGEVGSLTATEEDPFISARLNEDGWLAVTAGLENYKGGVTVYNSQMDEVFLFRASDRFVIDAYVTDDNSTLAAVTLGQENSVFVSNIVLYELDQEDPAADYDVTDGLVAAVGEQDGQLVTVSDTCLTYASPAGEVRATYSYAGSYLREYDLHGDGFTALLLNRYKSGGVGRLVTVDTDGQEIAALDVNEEILSISAAGRYLAVLYTDSLVVYNEDLQAYATYEGTDYGSLDLVAVTSVERSELLYKKAQVAAFFQILHNLLAGFVAVKALVLAAQLIDLAVVVQHPDNFQVVAQTHLEVVGVMGGGHLDAAGAEFHFGVVIGNHTAIQRFG